MFQGGGELERDDALLLAGAGEENSGLCREVDVDAWRIREGSVCRSRGLGKKRVSWMPGGRTNWTGRRQRLIFRRPLAARGHGSRQLEQYERGGLAVSFTAFCELEEESAAVMSKTRSVALTFVRLVLKI